MEPLVQLLRRLDHVNQNQEQNTYGTRLQGSHSSTSNDGDLVDSFELLGISSAKERFLRNRTNEIIISSLSYDQMITRYEGIIEPYPETFKWVFSDAVAEQLPWDCFVSWLRTGNGIYWIGGKPGSGKSTLVKHIFEDKRFRRSLEIWAQKTPLCMASCFFWNSGTLEQRSQTGFFKTLLFQIFTQYPDLVPLALPELWADSYATLSSQGVSRLSPSTWSLRQLSTAFKSVLKQTRVPVKIAILVDGLDEFEGDHEEFVELLKDIGVAENVKLCVSSRPWIVFKDAFSACAKMSLQSLTYQDIGHYTRNRFDKSPAFCSLASADRESKSILIQEVVEKAQGVFLWVRLVVTSLLTGIRNRDGIEDLLKRLHMIPDDLDRLYTHLLDIIEPVYLAWASKTFQISRKARELENKPFERADTDSTSKLQMNQLTLSSFSLGMDNELDMEQSQKFLLSSFEALCQKTDVYITVRCGGLLEVVCPSISGKAPHRQGKCCFRAPLQYIHRTARDYLELPDHWSRILDWTATEEFDPSLSLLEGCVKLQSLWFMPQPCSDMEIPSYVHKESQEFAEDDQQITISSLVYAKNVNCSDRALKAAQVKCLDHLDAIRNRASPKDKHWGNNLRVLRSRIHFPHESFLDLATVFQLADYVDAKLELRSEPTHLLASILLHRLFPNKDWLIPPEFPYPTAKMVSVLLSHGADPNWKGRGLSPWENSFSLRYIRNCRASKDSEIINQYFKILEVLLSAGGDPHIKMALLHEYNVDTIQTAVSYTPLQLLNGVKHLDPVAVHDIITTYLETIPKPTVAACMNCQAGEPASAPTMAEISSSAVTCPGR
jgi:hypothetical protein